MWISKKIADSSATRLAEKGKVTLSSNEFEVSSTISQRSMESFAPYGYNSKAPIGEEVMLLPSVDGQAVIGSLCNNDTLESGEIKITSKGGAYILLKNDGTIELNSVVVTKEGAINNGV